MFSVIAELETTVSMHTELLTECNNFSSFFVKVSFPTGVIHNAVVIFNASFFKTSFEIC